MNIDELIAYLLTPIGQIALIIGIAEMLKKIGFPSKYIPLLDVIIGLVGGIVVYGISFNYGIIKGIMLGLAIGLSACGLFSGVKNIIEKSKGA
jgi:hypothetical protein